MQLRSIYTIVMYSNLQNVSSFTFETLSLNECIFSLKALRSITSGKDTNLQNGKYFRRQVPIEFGEGLAKI